MKNYYFQTGFTLIEIVVTISIFVILSMGIMGLVGTVLRDSNRQGSSIANADQSRKLVAQITKELRNAVTGDNGAYAVGTVNNQELVFYSDIDSDTGVERVRYYLSSGKLYRGVIEPTGSPVGYSGAESSRVVQNDVANNASTPIFYYYNNLYDDIVDNPLTQPVNNAQVTYIKVNLQIFKKTTADPNGYFTVSSGTALRSLKTNLGN